MNDRFKFRAYNKELRKMYEVDTICPYEDNHTKGGEVFLKGIQYNSFYFPEEVEVMQCTGLKDKNGKLIYEADIVKFNFDTDEIKAVVSWDDKELIGFYLNTTDYFKDKYVTDYDFYKNDYEVIGNIYENKELLESEG